MMAGRIIRSETAFKLDGDRHSGAKSPRQIIQNHVNFIKKLPSLVVADGRVDPAHIRYAAHDYRKPAVGGGERPSDQWVVPLARTAHTSQHDFGNEKLWWERHGIDPCFVALILFANSGNEETCSDFIHEHRRELL